VVLGDPLCTGHVIIRMRSEICSLDNGINAIFSHITWLKLRRNCLKLNGMNTNWGPGFQTCRSFLPPPGDRSRDTAHAQRPFQVIVM